MNRNMSLYRFSMVFLFYVLPLLSVSPCLADNLCEAERTIQLPGGQKMSFCKVWLGIDENNPQPILVGKVNGKNEFLPPTGITGLHDDKKDLFFYLGKIEVTKGQFAAVMGTPQPDDAEKPQAKLTVDAMNRFINALNELLKKEPNGAGVGKGAECRLPAYQEWLFAAHGGHKVTASQFKSAHPYVGSIDNYEWSANNSGRQVHKCGVLDPNPLGLKDMLGNVEEVTSSVGYSYTICGGNYTTSDLSADTVRGYENQALETLGFRLALVVGDSSPDKINSPVNPPPPLDPKKKPENSAQLKEKLKPIQTRIEEGRSLFKKQKYDPALKKCQEAQSQLQQINKDEESTQVIGDLISQAGQCVKDAETAAAAGKMERLKQEALAKAQERESIKNDASNKTTSGRNLIISDPDTAKAMCGEAIRLLDKNRGLDDVTWKAARDCVRVATDAIKTKDEAGNLTSSGLDFIEKGDLRQAIDQCQRAVTKLKSKPGLDDHTLEAAEGCVRAAMDAKAQ